LHLLSTERGARCLDGSPAGFYIHKGTAPNDKKFIISMDSGGFCFGFTLE
jgi:O-palmitoleoyl-L-serine hydrolase